MGDGGCQDIDVTQRDGARMRLAPLGSAGRIRPRCCAEAFWECENKLHGAEELIVCLGLGELVSWRRGEWEVLQDGECWQSHRYALATNA